MRSALQTKELESVKERIVSGLKRFGISTYAAKAFVAVAENQSLSATTICKLTGIPDSKVYYALKELDERGLVMIQHGSPSLYRTSRARHVLSGLEARAEQNYRNQVRGIRDLERLLYPLIRLDKESTDVELAYIIKGARNILEEMKEAVLGSRKEIILLTSSRLLALGLTREIDEARNRDVSVKVALDRKLLKPDAGNEPVELRANRFLICDCNVLLVDSEKLITVDIEDENDQYALVTQSQGMITMSRKFYDNPSCCIQK